MHKPLLKVSTKIHVKHEIPTIMHQSWKNKDLPKVSYKSTHGSIMDF